MTQAASQPAAQTSSHKAFEFLHRQHISALKLDVEQYRHRKTGALHYHLASDNPENVFLVALRTVPVDSTGVAHILEHTVLCGSERYPVRDPFFMMIRRSLNTFMNAFTSSDWTAYPFASQNRKDFFNLMDVYLDAVFFARLDKLDFAQEGHRIEYENPTDKNSPLVFKGVVFNEMKGAMSSPVSTLWQSLTEHLFPSTTYHYNSGGDPIHIPDLSYEQLQEFYKIHYHPSNAVFMTYGDIPAEEHHARFEELALKRFDALDKQIRVNNETRFDKPQYVEDSYALSEADARGDKTHVVLGWLLGNNTDPYELMKAHLLSSVLLDNGASPLRYALETTDLGSAPSPLCGLEDSNHEMSFMCGLEGTRPEHADAIEKMILQVLEDVATKGVSQEQAESVLHQLELHQREIGGDGYPYGLQLILEGLPAAIHYGDPVTLLDIEPVLQRLREDIRNPEFIPAMIRDLLLDNTHRVRLCMKPDTGLDDARDTAEKQRLDKIKSSLDTKDQQNIIELAAALEKRQRQEDDPEILPKVGLEDIPASIQIPQVDATDNSATPVSFYGEGTNGIVYQQWIADMPTLDNDSLSLLPVYKWLLTEVGVGKRDYLQTQMWQDAVSGGISASTNIRGSIEDVVRTTGHFIFSGKALIDKHEALTALMCETLQAPRFDEHKRIHEIINQMRTRAEHSITGNGHSLAMSAACQNMSPVASLNHRLSGLAGILSLKLLDDELNQESLAELESRLHLLHNTITRQQGQILVVADDFAGDMLLQTLNQNWQSPGSGKTDAHLALSSSGESVSEMWVTSTQVNFCARAYPTVPAGHDDSAALTVLGGYLRNGYLHRSIREQGGAYGGGAGQDNDNACFRFFSYRDPRLEETLQDFDRAIQWMLNEKHEHRLLEEAILGVIGALDKPGSPAGDAKKAFHNALHGRDERQHEIFRQRITGVAMKDLLRVTEKYLLAENASTAVITHSGNAGKANDLGMQLREL